MVKVMEDPSQESPNLSLKVGREPHRPLTLRAAMLAPCCTYPISLTKPDLAQVDEVLANVADHTVELDLEEGAEATRFEPIQVKGLF